ncbi:hypothetical protein ATE47_11305 [Chryseobacterium sp. IHB B 17019]|jgi:hypothetical protein|uniref:hypothetical protein n=1 Tax=Chryseobacterium sp. IHB B 17019 TaxID=1721091 RepID=UPI000722B81C|nr:hypothetical protein [Chryseobacterium sp. IHB B 17019]ALR31075.1 hypothetical protein ATE47_11305 [Chryseobacterium sp. IHB B 17019]
MRFNIILLLGFFLSICHKGKTFHEVNGFNQVTRSSQWKNVDEMFLYCNANNIDLIIDKDIYINKRIKCKVNVLGEARIIIDTKFKDAGIDFVRDDEGRKINYNKKIEKFQKLSFVKDKHVYFINSSQILTNRKDNAPYLKNEFLLQSQDVSNLTSYAYEGNINIIEFKLSDERIAKNLNVVIVGDEMSNDDGLAFIRNYRDNMKFLFLQIRNQTKFKLSVGFENATNYNTVMENPVINGFYKAGSGYGIANYSSREFRITGGRITNCRHAYTGRNTFNVTIKNGYFSDGIDDHWTDNFVADAVTISAAEGGAAFQFAGNNITINKPIVVGTARILLGIREDTPFLGGKVKIIEPSFTSELSSDIYIFAGTTPNANFENSPEQEIKMPDILEISSPKIKSNASKIFIIYQPEIRKKFISYPEIRLTGTIIIDTNKNPDVFGVLTIKNSIFQLNKMNINVDSFNLKKVGAMNATLIYCVESDGNNKLASNVLINNTRGWDNIKIVGKSVENLKITNSFFPKLLLEKNSLNDMKSSFDKTAFGNYDEISKK